MSKAYSSNLTQSQFELIEPLIPVAKSGGRPREVEIWAVLNAIFYVLVQGCKWRDLPENFPAWQTVYTYFRNWRIDGRVVVAYLPLPQDYLKPEGLLEYEKFRIQDTYGMSLTPELVEKNDGGS